MYVCCLDESSNKTIERYGLYVFENMKKKCIFVTILLLSSVLLLYFSPQKVAFCAEMFNQSGDTKINIEVSLSARHSFSGDDHATGTVQIDGITYTLAQPIDLEVEDIVYLKKTLASSENIIEPMGFHCNLVSDEQTAVLHFTPKHDHLQINLRDKNRHCISKYFSRISEIIPVE